MEKTPLISIIIPVYNVETCLEECLQSVLAQILTDFEVIMIDDGSQDRSGEICARYVQSDDRFRLIRQDNQGVSGARNTGLNVISGRYFCFIDPDDRIRTDFLSYMTGMLENNQVDLAVCNFEIKSPEGSMLNRPIEETEEDELVFEQTEALVKVAKTDGISCGHVFDKIFRTEVFGDLRFDRDIHVYEDVLYCFRAILRTDRIAVSRKPVYIKRMSSQGGKQRKYGEREMTGLEALLRMLEELEKRIPDPVQLDRLKKVVKERYNQEVLEQCERCVTSLGPREQARYAGRLLDWLEKADLAGYSIMQKVRYKMYRTKFRKMEG